MTGGAGFAGAGVVDGAAEVVGEGLAGGAICVAAGDRISLEAVLVPFCPGWCPMPNTTANTIATNTAAAIQPQAELPVRFGVVRGIALERVFGVAVVIVRHDGPPSIFCAD